MTTQLTPTKATTPRAARGGANRNDKNLTAFLETFRGSRRRRRLIGRPFLMNFVDSSFPPSLPPCLPVSQIRLRNSRAALAADRRVWLLERRDRELAALSEEAARRPPPSASRRKPHRSGGGAADGDAGNSSSSPRCTDAAGGESSGGADGGDGARGGGRGGAAVAATQPPLLEGLRPECEAVMRALFCRVDRCVGAPGRWTRKHPTI